MTIGERIHKLRVKRGWSMYQLAQKAEVSPTSIAHWESGKTLPHIDKAVLCARALGTTVEALTGNAEYCRDREVLALKKEIARLRAALLQIQRTSHTMDIAALNALFPEEARNETLGK